MSTRLRVGVVGVGFVGRQHVDALRRLGDVEVSAVAASTAQRGREAAQAMRVDRGVGDWRELTNSPSLDVIHACVPNDLHHDVVAAALSAGKDVVCEKPLALSLGEAQELARLASASDRTAVLCQNYRYFAMAIELRARVRAGDLGALHAVRGSYLQDWLLGAGDTNWRVDPARGGASRAVADIGSHWVDLAEVLTGCRLEAVMAQLGTVHGRRPGRPSAETFAGRDGEEDGDGWAPVATEDQAALLLRFAGGLQGSLTLSQVAAGHKNALDLSLDGTDGSATWRQERPDQLFIGRRDRPSELVSRDARQLSAEAAGVARLPAGHNEGWGDGLRNLLAAAYSDIRRRRGEDAPSPPPDGMPLPTFDDGVRHLAFVEAALRSAADGRWVSVTEVLTAARPSGEAANA